MERTFGFVRSRMLLTILSLVLLASSALVLFPDSNPANANPSSAAADAIQTTAASASAQPTFPIRAAFYYPWFPEAWTQSGTYPYTRYTPTLGYYGSSDPQTIQKQIAAMQYGNIQAGIASWWGPGQPTAAHFADLLNASDGSGFKWAIYQEQEGQGNPSVAQLRADLTYIRDTYATHDSYLKVNGKFVVFVYNADDTSCEVVNRWAEARQGIDVYLVLKVFSGYRNCATQPDSWHQYGSASASDSQQGYSYSISPGFWQVNESQPRLARDLNRWQQNVRDMVASGAPWQLVTTFNEWGEGTAVESATQWESPSGYGTFLDALHNNGRAAGQSATPTATAPAPTATPQATPTGSSPSTAPTATATSTPAGASSSTPVTVFAAGDIASCSSTGDDATAAIVKARAGTVLTLGDNAYEVGSSSQYTNCYDPSWGPFKSRTRPTPGNHDYLTAGAAGYFGYFGAAAGDPSKGYYAYNLGNNWRAYALNSNCSNIGGCGVTSAEYAWLQADLAANPGMNVLAYWHVARYSSGAEHGNGPVMDPIWDLLVANGAELVLTGHDHDYERFAPIGANDQRDAAGVREFVVGTGGKSHYAFGAIVSGSQVRNSDTYGVLQLQLYPDRYTWQFIPQAGKSFTDSGSTNVH